MNYQKGVLSNLWNTIKTERITDIGRRNPVDIQVGGQSEANESTWKWFIMTYDQDKNNNICYLAQIRKQMVTDLEWLDLWLDMFGIMGK